MTTLRTCQAPNCDKKRHGSYDVEGKRLDLCSMHRERLRQHGELEPRRQPYRCSRCFEPGHNVTRCEMADNSPPGRNTWRSAEHLDGLPPDMKPRYYPGRVKCLSCGREFVSDCKRRFRQCRRCRAGQETDTPDPVLHMDTGVEYG